MVNLNSNKGKFNQKALMTFIVMIVVVLFFIFKLVVFFLTPADTNTDQNKQMEQFYQWEVDKQNK